MAYQPENGQLATDGVQNAGAALTPKFARIAASTSGNNTIVAAVTGKKIRVLAYNFIANGTVNAKFQTAAGGTDLTGLKYCVANSGLVAPFNPVGWFSSEELLDSAPITKPSHLKVVESMTERIAVISEDQRTQLVDLAKEAGVIEKLGSIVNAAGFEMLAHITVDRFTGVAQAIRDAGANEPDVTHMQEDTDYIDATILEPPVDEAPKLSKAESQKADHIAAIREIEAEDPERVATVLDGRELASMTAGQVKEVYLALQ